jgi:creatinine amidohydrolase/Fe(II)-dependent formamide hydrolase-like protein
VEIAASIFGGEKFGSQDLAGSVIEKAEQGEFGAAIFEPAVQTGIEQEHFAFPGTRKATLAVSRCAPLARRAKTG